MTEQEKELFERATKEIEALQEEIERLTQPPFALTTVLKMLDEDRCLAAGAGGIMVVSTKQPEMPEEEASGLKAKAKKIAEKLKFKKLPKLNPGDTVLVNPNTGAMVEVLKIPMTGMEAKVKRVFEGDQMELEGGGGQGTLVYKGLVAECVKPGDTVLLDRTGNIALEMVPKDLSRFSVDTNTGVKWEDVGGQDEAKAALREAVEGPIRHKELYRAYGKKPLKGALLWGPPGCGKTLLAKAVANGIREAHGAGEAATGFIYVKGPEILNMWVGNSEANIRALFERAKEHKAEHGYPAVVFIDEADAVLGRRGGDTQSVLGSTIVPMFLAEMDGIGDSGAFVLLATNRQDTLDPAIVREGRIDRKVRVGRPGLYEANQILQIHLKRTKTVAQPQALANTATSNLFSEAYKLYLVKFKGGEIKPFYIKNLISGAMLAGVVDLATSVAIERDAAAGKVSGVGHEDVQEAVKRIVESNKRLNHDDALAMFAEEHGREIEGYQVAA